MRHPKTSTHPRILLFLTLVGIMLLVGAGAGISLAEQVVAGDVFPAQEITKEMGCVTCGMYPASYPQWQQQIVFKDKTAAAFDGGKCLFRYLLNMAKLDATHTPADIAMVWVKDFNTGAWLDGTKATYVVGSTVMGPMGKEIIPFADQTAANAFQQKNGGSVEPYGNITMDTITPLMGGMMHKHHGGPAMKMP